MHFFRAMILFAGLTCLGATTACTRNGNLTGVWASSPTDVWIVGQGGAILRWNGSALRRDPTPSLLPSSYKKPPGIFGDGRRIFVWAGASLVQWDGAAWSDVALPDQHLAFFTGVGGSGAGPLWVVEQLGHILEGDVQGGLKERVSGIVGVPRGIWGSGTQAWVVGSNGTAGVLWHLDSEGWHDLADPGLPALSAVWGSGPSDVWAVGDKSVIRHYDGTAWKQLDPPGDVSLGAIWGSGPRDVWAVGSRSGQGAILRFDGAAWTDVSPEHCKPLATVSGTGPRDVWAVGAEGTILHWDGSAVSTVDVGDLIQISVGAFPIAG